MAAAEQLITENLAIWSSAVQTKSAAGRGKSNKRVLYGIKKLRELILELAVRGLLVQQDPSDEPASELLKKIADEKTRLLKETKIRKEKSLPPIVDEVAPFQLPNGWAWSRLIDICQLITQGPNPQYDGVEEDEYRVIKTKDFYDHVIHYGNADRISISVFEANAKHRLQTGDVIFGLVGKGSTGKCNIFIEQDGTSYIYTRATGLIRLIDAELVSPRYLKTVFISGYGKGKTSDLEDGSTGQIVIKTSLLKELEFPVPPLEEQTRIVVKVDELMILCDQLEQQQEASITAHQTLVQTLLDALTTASERDGFTAAWTRIADYFDTLFTTEWSIDQLKQTILQLAVMGKLVAQDPNDEPASELLKKIVTEKAKLVKDGEIKKQKPLQPIEKDEKPFELPNGWDFVRFGAVLDFSGGSQPPKSMFSDKKLEGYVQLIQIRDLGPNPQPVYVPEDSVSKFCTTTDIMIGRYGASVGKVFWGKNGAYNVALIKLHNEAGAYTQQFLFLLMKSPLGQNLFSGISRSAQAGFRKGDIEGNVLPLFALEAQERIVAKVDELMARCDSLKTRINAAQTTQLQISDAMAGQLVG